jgi:hypothetical protein
MLSAGSQTVLPTVRFSSATTVVFTTAASTAERTEIDRAYLRRDPTSECRKNHRQQD